jgi:hypothetical protein
LLQIRVVSSVGLEHYLDRVGATGSNPVQPTKPSVAPAKEGFFFHHYQLNTDIIFLSSRTPQAPCLAVLQKPDIYPQNPADNYVSDNSKLQ